MNSTLYEKDYYLWLKQTALLLREGRFTRLDLPNLVEELEALGRSEKRALESNLLRVLQHLLKYKYQPQKRSGSWLLTIREHRRRVDRALADSPSLKPYLTEVFEELYQEARKQAADETEMPLDEFPLICPWTPEQTLDADFLAT